MSKKVVSYSQYTTYHQCQQKYKLQYIDKLGINESNIHSVFGTSLHETVQEFLQVMYNESKKKALETNWDDFLQTRMVENFQKEEERMGKAPCTREQLIEFYNDGINILNYFKGKLNKFYPKQGYKLLDIERKLEVEVKNNVVFWGFIDVLLEDVISGKKIIIDIKTSTSGWNKYQKADKVKTAQMLLYKKLYSELEDVDMNDLAVEYQIMKRKVEQDPSLQFHIPRISKFIPPNGKPSVTKAWDSFMSFVNSVFDENGEYITNRIYHTTVNKLCDYCQFKENKLCPEWKK